MVTVPPPGARTIDEILAVARGRFRRLAPHQAFTELAEGAVLIDIRYAPGSWGPEPSLSRLVAPFRWHLPDAGAPA
jgi:hypothetical protein